MNEENQVYFVDSDKLPEEALKRKHRLEQDLKSVSDRIAIVSEGKLVDILSPQASDADYGLAMSGIKPSEHTEKGGTEE